MKDRIAFTCDSSQSTGKTVTINALKAKYNIFNTQTTPTRKLITQDDINNSNTDIQLKILENRRNYIVTHDKFIQDRSLVILWSYTKYFWDKGLSDLKPEVKDFIYEECKTIMQSYLIDKIIVLPIEFEPVSDGFRECDPQQRRDLQDLVDETISEWKLEYKTIRPSGSVEERVNTISEYIDWYLK